MALTVGELTAYLKVDDKDFTSKLDGGEKKFGAFSSSAVKYGAAIGAAVVAAGVALYQVGSTFDQVSDTIRVGTGATGQALDGLVGSAKNIGREVPANFSDIGTAVADLNTRLGLTGKPLESMATQFLNLSRITGTDLSSNIQGLTRVFGDWSIETGKQPAALDAIFRASQATGVGVDKLGQQVVQFGAPLRQLGFGFEESLAMLGSFDKAGVNTEVVMGSMRIALGKMARAGEDPQKTFARVTDEIKNAGSAGEANALALELFGAKAGPDMAAAIREGRFELGGLVDQIANGSETINSAAKDTESFAESWQVFKNRALLAIEPIATRFFNMLSDAMAWINNAGTPALVGLAAVFGTLAAAIGVAALSQIASMVAASAATVASVALQGAKWAWLAVQAMASAVRIAAAWLISMGPIALVIAAVVGLVVVIVKNFDTIKDVIGKAWTWVKDTTAKVWDAITSFFTNWWAKLRGEFTAALEAVKNAVRAAWDWVRSTTTAVWDAIRNALTATWNSIKAVFTAALDAIKSTVTTVWNAIKAVFTAALDFVKAAVTTVFDAIKAFVQRSIDGWRHTITSGWDAIKAVFSGALEFVKNVVSTGMDNLRNNFTNAVNALKGVATGAWDAVRSAFSGGIGGVVSLMASLPGQILSAVGNLGNLLVNAGRSVIDGFIRGLTAGFQKVRDTLGNLTSMLPDWKGPADRDAVILRDAGRLVMGGFERGLLDKFSDVRRTLGDVTDLIGMEVGGPGYVQSRLGISSGLAAPAPTVNVAAPDLSSLAAKLDELGDRVEDALRRQTRDETMMRRSG